MFLPKGKEINKKQKDKDKFLSVFHTNISLVKSIRFLMVKYFSKLIVFDNMTKKKITKFYSFFLLNIVFLVYLLFLK